LSSSIITLNPLLPISGQYTGWVIRIGNFKFLNPGLPEVREYVTNVVMDVVNRYDVDGVHFDDYFYPYPPDNITNQDAQTFENFPNGFTNLGDWRRDNVNELLRMIHDSIQVVKPEVKFGMSPFGIYKNGVPNGITGMDAHNVIYCDPLAWIDEKIIDYLAPQLYWQFDGPQDYGKLLPWWASQVDDRHLYPGQALYRSGSFPIGEIPRQIRLNRSTPNTYGSIMFRAQNLFDNSKGVTDSLNNNYYKYKALVPSMSWKDIEVPNIPQNLRFEPLANIRGNGILWDNPSAASDGDTASMFVIYQLDNSSPNIQDFDNPANIWKISGNNYTGLNSTKKVADIMYFAVSSLDDNHNESSVSNILEVEVDNPELPLAISPLDNSLNQKDTTLIVWNNSNGSSYNRLQLALTETFDSITHQSNEIVDTFKAVTDLDGLTKYYWRVSALNIAGESEYSTVRNFTTGFPIPPLLSLPADKTTLEVIETDISWYGSSVAESYKLEIAEGFFVEHQFIVIDTILTDTAFTALNLKPDQIYSWCVRGINEYGSSKLSDIFKFKTGLISSSGQNNEITKYFALEQNYPNPFNPETNIKFSLHESGYTTLIIFDMLGREVVKLKDEYMNNGKYTVMFNANKLSSGVYFYVLKNGSNIDRKKMLLLK